MTGAGNTHRDVFTLIKGPLPGENESFYLKKVFKRSLWEIALNKAPGSKENIVALAPAKDGPIAVRAQEDGVITLIRGEPETGKRLKELIASSECSICISAHKPA